MAGAELPCVVVNVARGGPGLGTIQPGQSDYFQSVKGGGHGDYNMVVLAPNSVQEMYDFVGLGFDLAFKYRTPVLILADGVIGQMMEKIELQPAVERLTDEQIAEAYPWATTGKKPGQKRTIVTSVQLEPLVQEAVNKRLQAKYREIRENEVRYETYMCDDAEYVLVAYGCSSRMCRKVAELARADGHKVGLFRPVTLFPFPQKQLRELSGNVKGFMAVELSEGQLVEDVRAYTDPKCRVEHFGRTGGVIHTPSEIYEALKEKLL